MPLDDPSPLRRPLRGISFWKRWVVGVLAGRWSLSLSVLIFGAFLGWVVFVPFFHAFFEEKRLEGNNLASQHVPPQKGESPLLLQRQVKADISQAIPHDKKDLRDRKEMEKKSTPPRPPLPDVPPPAEAVDLLTLPVSPSSHDALDLTPSPGPMSEQTTGMEAPHQRFERSSPLKEAPILSVAEKVQGGVLPKKASDGRLPWQVYKRSVEPAVLKTKAPKIAFVLGGMGLDPLLTQEAMERLPGPVSFAFAPHAEHLQRQVNEARRFGHEVFLQIPMQGISPMPEEKGRLVLQGGADDMGHTLDKLKHMMAQTAGYVGILNYKGAVFLQDSQALAGVFKVLAERGVSFLEEGVVPASQAMTLAHSLKVPALKGDVSLDGALEAGVMAQRLGELEKKARQTGRAIAVGTGFGGTIEAVSAWIEGARARGIVLVPVSAFYEP